MTRTMLITLCAGSALATVVGARPVGAASALATCQDTVSDAAIRLGGAAERKLGACLIRGIECLVGDPAAREACCTRAGDGCGDDLGRLGKENRRFAARVGSRRCAAVPFADLASPTGLGFGDLAARCAALTPPGSAGDLPSLTDCLRLLTLEETVCQLASAKLPRAAEGLACMGLESEFEAAAGLLPGECSDL
jgi:hypothetical protein